MAAPVYLGDEVSAAGFRLAGALVRTPPPGDETAALARARAQAPLVLVSARRRRAHRRGPRCAPRWRRSRRWCWSCPTCRGEVPLPDLAARLRAPAGARGMKAVPAEKR